MAAVLAPHHATKVGRHVADRYGNDPFVWVSPFLWSHCHARSRSRDFGLGVGGPLVHGKDAVFFLSTDPETNDVLVDCVFLIAEVAAIGEAEARFAPSHPARHYHFDQQRSPKHLRSELTRIADPELSFLPSPPMPLGAWIENHLAPRSMPALDYFRLKKRKNVRVVISDAQGLYDRLLAWSKLPGHSALKCLPLRTLRQIAPLYPANWPIHWHHD
jgi:hypothetical protein